MFPIKFLVLLFHLILLEFVPFSWPLCVFEHIDLNIFKKVKPRSYIDINSFPKTKLIIVNIKKCAYIKIWEDRIAKFMDSGLVVIWKRNRQFEWSEFDFWTILNWWRFLWWKIRGDIAIPLMIITPQKLKLDFFRWTEKWWKQVNLLVRIAAQIAG